MQVLLVEDDDDIRETVLELLADRGILATGARHGVQALELLRTGARPRVIVLDLMMPVMDGYAFRAEQLADPAIAAIPVIVMSASAKLDEAVAPLKVARALAKPVGAAMLLDALRPHLV